MHGQDQSIADFYQTSMGRMVRHLIAQKLKPAATHSFPPSHPNLDVATLGYARPYLKYLHDHFPHLINLETLDIAPLAWPSASGSAIKTAQVHAQNLPLLDASLDLLVMIHCLETSPHQQHTIDEIYRVLKGQGKLILTIPHRSSIWAGSDNNPFGLGQPFSNNQIKKLLRLHGFEIEKIHQCLSAPPSTSTLYPRYAPLVEKMPSPMGGVLIVEAVKMIYAVRGDRAQAQQKSKLKNAGRLAGAKSPRSTSS